jgi:hypothetical protein
MPFDLTIPGTKILKKQKTNNYDTRKTQLQEPGQFI